MNLSETRKQKDALKGAGYKWALKKMRRYFADVPVGGHRQFDMDEIRRRYGSQRVMTRPAYPMEEANALRSTARIFPDTEGIRDAWP